VTGFRLAVAPGPQNNALKLTRSIGLRRMEALRATMRRQQWPSQLNAMFGGLRERARVVQAEGLRRVAGALLLGAVVAACNAAGEAKQMFVGMHAVEAAVAPKVAPGAVKVNVNASRITLSVVNSPIGQLPKAEKKVKARDLARVAYEAYPGRKGLEAVDVAFVVQMSAGVVRVGKGTDSYSFKAATLATAEASPAAQGQP
jgi:hypothetical protein